MGSRQDDGMDPTGVKALLLQVVRKDDGMSLLQVGIARYFCRKYSNELNERYLPTGAAGRILEFLDRAEARLTELAKLEGKQIEDCIMPAGDAVLSGLHDEIERLEGVPER